MVAYRTSDVKMSWKHPHNGRMGGAPLTCGYVKEGLELEPYEEDIYTDDNNHDHTKPHVLSLTQTAQMETITAAYRRKKRQADQYEYTPTKTRCPLLLVADYRFFQEMGGGNTKTTINYLVSLLIIKNYQLCF